MRFLLLLFFFLSGACGLVYEVVWTKLFTLSMGSTTYAISTVIATFMGGLALGSRYGGKWIDRRGNPLLVYGMLEGGVGIYCMVIPLLTKLIPVILGPFYDRYYVSNQILFGFMRFLLSAGILIIPTVLMGASLPVLAKYYARDKSRFGWEVGRLYSVNTLGAVCGSFTAGFLLLPYLGQHLSIYIAAAVNMGICAAVMIYRFGVKREGEKGEYPKQKAEPTPKARVEVEGQIERWGKAVLWAALGVYAANGFAGMAYQVAWTRALTLSIGSSAYSFTIIVTVFIFGLAIGSGIGARLTDRINDPAIAMGFVEIMVGFFAIVGMWGLGRLPEWMVPLIQRYSYNWDVLVGVEFVLVGLLLILPTVCMGMVFPLAMKTVGLCRSGVGEPVGLAYGINTAGAIMGSLIAGFMLIPHLGLQNTITVANVMNWVSGGILLFVVGKGKPALRWAKGSVGLILGVIVTMIMPAWEVGIMNSGPFVYAAKTPENKKLAIEKRNILFQKDGVDTTVVVARAKGNSIFLRVNGKTDASTGPDMYTQELSGHIPMLINPNPKKVCIIGLASGVTLGSVTRHPVESVDVVELSEAVVEAADYFKGWNYDAMHDPRVHVIVGDGRNHLLMTKKKYDVVISEPSNPWIAGEAALFTKEFFEFVREHLEPGGVFCCWMQAYQTSSDQFRMVMRTFQAVFPEATLWETMSAVDYVLVGSLEPIRIDPARVDSRIKSGNVAKDLSRIAIGGVIDLLGRFIMGPRRSMTIAEKGEYHNDDQMQLEYMAPRYLNYAKGFYIELYEKVIKFADYPISIISPEKSNWPEGFGEALEREMKAGDIVHNAMYFRAQGSMKKAIELFAEANKISPHNTWNETLWKGVLDDIERRFIDSGKYNETIVFFEHAVKTDPENADLRARLGSSYMNFQRMDEAKQQFDIAISFDPKNYQALYGLGFINLHTRNFVVAEEYLRRCIEAKPDYAQAYSAMGVLMEEYKELSKAENYYRKAIELDNANAFAYANLGVLLVQNGDEKRRQEGRVYLEKAISLDPELAKREDIIPILKEGIK